MLPGLMLHHAVLRFIEDETRRALGDGAPGGRLGAGLDTLALRLHRGSRG